MVKYEGIEEEILDEIRKNPKISILKLANTLDVSMNTVGNYVDELKAEGKIIRVGGRYGGHWEVHDGKM